METKDPIIQQIKETRESRGLSATQLAEILKVPVDRLYKWEHGKATPKYKDRQKILTWINGKTEKTSPGPEVPDIGENFQTLPSHEFLKALITLTESNKGLVDSNKSITDTNRVIADTNSILAMKLVQQESTGSDQPGIPASALATIMALREQVIELTAAQLNISAQEAESVLGIKAVAAMKRVSKKDIPSGEGMKHRSETH